MENNKIVDFHSHPIFDSYKKALSNSQRSTVINNKNDPEFGLSYPDWTLEQHIDNMDQHGIDLSILSLPDLSKEIVGHRGHAKARAFNEELAKSINEYPNRLGGFAVIPVDDIDAAINETVYALNVLKLDGVCISPQYNGLYLGDCYYDSWFQEMNELQTILFVHPGTPDYFDLAKSNLDVSVLEFMFETTRMVTNMVLSGAKQKFNRIKIIAPHGGGTIPYLSNRIKMTGSMAVMHKGGVQLTGAQIMEQLGSFYYDLTACMADIPLDALLKIVPPEKLLIGFDFPMMPHETIDLGLATFKNYAGLDADEKQQIYSGNAHKILKRFN